MARRTTNGREGGERPWRWLVLGGAFVAVVPLSAELARRSSGGGAAGWVIAQVVFTVLAFAVPQVQQVRAWRAERSATEREVEARAETRVAVNDALDPVVRLLGELVREPDADERDLARARITTLVLKTASEFIGLERARACWFRLGAGPPATLQPAEASGRARPATTELVAGTPAGDAALDLVLDDRDLLCRDVQEDPPLGWDLTAPRDYRTFVAVSVIADDVAFGMLTLDAPEPDGLDGDDLGLLRLMAGILAVALAAP